MRNAICVRGAPHVQQTMFRLQKNDRLRVQAVAPRCVKEPQIVRGLSSEKVVVQASIQILIISGHLQC